jgi:hypothetical protein
LNRLIVCLNPAFNPFKALIESGPSWEHAQKFIASEREVKHPLRRIARQFVERLRFFDGGHHAGTEKCEARGVAGLRQKVQQWHVRMHVEPVARMDGGEHATHIGGLVGSDAQVANGGVSDLQPRETRGRIESEQAGPQREPDRHQRNDTRRGIAGDPDCS